MKKITVFSLCLVFAMIAKQWFPNALGEWFPPFMHIIGMLTAVLLCYIMTNVGREVEIDKSDLRGYGKDYLVASGQATIPWLAAAIYLFVVFMLPTHSIWSWDAWVVCLLVGRFAAPTSAGILLSMLRSAGLEKTWMYVKARILAVLDDIDTVLLMVLLTMLINGFSWQLAVSGVLMGVFLVLAWRYLDALRVPSSWPAILLYGVIIVGASESVYLVSKLLDPSHPLHIEVLLPAFALGCMIRPRKEPGKHEKRKEERVSTIISAAFMVLVGLGMPLFSGQGHSSSGGHPLTATIEFPGWGAIALHVVVLTVLINAGKLAPLFFYRDVPFRQRLALSIGMWPRGEVGAGVLIAAMSYGVGGPIVTVAMLCLAGNLVLTGVFIAIVKELVEPSPVPVWNRVSTTFGNGWRYVSDIPEQVVQFGVACMFVVRRGVTAMGEVAYVVWRGAVGVVSTDREQNRNLTPIRRTPKQLAVAFLISVYFMLLFVAQNDANGVFPSETSESSFNVSPILVNDMYVARKVEREPSSGFVVKNVDEERFQVADYVGGKWPSHVEVTEATLSRNYDVPVVFYEWRSEDCGLCNSRYTTELWSPKGAVVVADASLPLSVVLMTWIDGQSACSREVTARSSTYCQVVLKKD